MESGSKNSPIRMINVLRKITSGKLISGALTLATGNGFEQGARMLRNMILARILLPECFGVAALVVAAISSLDALTEVGVRQAVIQSELSEDRCFLSAAWVFSALRGLVIVGLLLLLSPWLVKFFHIESYGSLFRLGCVAVLANCMTSPMSFARERKMEYTRVTLVSTLGAVTGIALTVGLSFWFQEPWVLVMGYVSESVFKCLLSYVAFPFFPDFNFKPVLFTGILSYSRGMAGLPLLTLIYVRADIFCLSRFQPSATVGRYAMCLTVAMAPFAIVTLASRVLLPAFSKNQGNFMVMSDLYDRVVSTLIWILVPLSAFLFVGGGPLVGLILGRSYAAYGSIVALLFIAQGFFFGGSPAVTVFMATGQPGLSRVPALSRAVVAAILLPICASRFGAIGVAFGMILSASVGFFLQARALRKILGYRLSRYVQHLMRPGIVSLSALIICIGIRLVFVPSDNVCLALYVLVFTFAISTQKNHIVRLIRATQMQS